MAVPYKTAPTSCQNCPYLTQSLMSTCQKEELELISTSKISQSYKKGQSIFQTNNRLPGLYCIHQGKVKVSRVSSDGKEQIMRLAQEGDALGYRSLMVGNTATTSAIALSDCVVCMVPRPDFFSVIGQNAQFSTALTKLLAKDLGRMEERMMHAAFKPVRGRLAEALLMLHELFRPATEMRFSIPVTREDLAALTSTAKETASRLLSEFREEGLVSTYGSRITILNIEKITQLSALYE